MKCLKKTKRTFFNLLEIFSCDNCDSYIDYEYIYIGNDVINIYKLNKECINKDQKLKFIKLFLKEMIINDKDIYLILNYEQFISLFLYFPLFLNNNDLYIFVE